MAEHTHTFMRYHADYCHRYETGEICECGEKRYVKSRHRWFGTPDSAWWHWGRAGCAECESLMSEAGLDPQALADEDLACREMDRQFARLAG